MKRIGILTGGGDCPGLNPVIRAVVKTAISKYGMTVVGFKNGYKGLYINETVELTLENTSGILHRGGTILFSSNKDNLFDYLVPDENGNMVKRNVSHVGVENIKKNNIDAMIIIGGDGTLTSGRDFARLGVPVIGVPKTIDNDLALQQKHLTVFIQRQNLITELLLWRLWADTQDFWDYLQVLQGVQMLFLFLKFLMILTRWQSI